MLTDQSMEQTLRKLRRLCSTLRERIFLPVGQAEMAGCFQTEKPLHTIPGREQLSPVEATWGGEGVYGWFLMDYTVPEELDGRALFLYPHMGFYEATLWVNGCIHSNYAAKFVEGSHGNHWCNRFTASAKAGEKYSFALECYAFHHMPGTSPLSRETTPFVYPTGPVDVCVRDEEYFTFLFDLITLLDLRRALPAESFRRAQLDNALYEAHLRLLYDPDSCSEEAFRQGLRDAAPLLKEELQRKNGGTAPYVGLIGHSHMDTAWLWPLTETEKKCARTYANTLNLMDEYEEYRFIQSSAWHGEWLRRDYPELFERIRQRVLEGRYEPNGGVWVECDCNLTGGEYMIRQILWGQRFTRRWFGYTSDAFWLPDTFGYSMAIPQIMKGCGIRYFLTTKMSWNDTNHFPLTSFLWEGLDGTRVLTHLNRTHQGPEPGMYQAITEGREGILEKRVSPMRLFSFGKGDGGGGPEFEMLEEARRLGDLEGTARSSYTTVSDFMKKLEETMVNPTVYAGELYLELHRGTLTNQHEIKHNNHACQIALHDMELALVQIAVRTGKTADGTGVSPLMETLLVHQFHDILPGTCIHPVHEETRRSVGHAIEMADSLTRSALMGDMKGTETVVYNPLSFDRTGSLVLDGSWKGIEGAQVQSYRDLEGREKTAVMGLTLPAFGSVEIRKTEETEKAASPFELDGDTLTTPYARIRFDENGCMASFVDLREERELVAGLPFNTFLMAEDVPADWDNWDVDADLMDKFRPAGRLLERKVVSQGPVELRIRSRYAISDKSDIEQDMVFHADTPQVDFETVMNWKDDHRFLKVAFDTALHTDGVRNEIQFGCIRRPNTRSTSQEKARFEVCNHKYSDLSEHDYGAAILNDSKYGISVLGGSMRLSLHKGGTRPDDLGDHGRHVCRYAFLPHMGGFSAENVVRPAYAFNYLPYQVTGGMALPSLVSTDQANVIIETVKPCEDAGKAYILRLYEAVGSYSRARLTFIHSIKGLYLCNMLEEEQEELKVDEPLVLPPFRILTLKVVYG